MLYYCYLLTGDSDATKDGCVYYNLTTNCYGHTSMSALENLI